MTGRMYLGPVRDMAHAGWLQTRYDGSLPTRDLSDLAAVFCIAKLAYAAGQDDAGDAAWGRFIDETSADEREQIEAQLDGEYPGVAAWSACLVDVAAANARAIAKAKRAQVTA